MSTNSCFQFCFTTKRLHIIGLDCGELIGALAQYLLAVEQGYAETGTRTSYAKHLRGAERLLLARAALSEFYWGVLNDCRAARIWNDAFRSGIISEIERQKLRRLLRPPPLICR